jgi:hypothetical protein
MLTVPLTELRPIPEDYRKRDPLGIASHIASITQQGETQTIFLVDLTQGLGLSNTP